jgi:hypothetical protein
MLHTSAVNKIPVLCTKSLEIKFLQNVSVWFDTHANKVALTINKFPQWQKVDP